MVRKSQPQSRWPKWRHPCTAFSWRTGQPCRQWATLGNDCCKRHGGGGRWSQQGWKRYLLWVLLPESIRVTASRSPVLDEEVELLCNILAQYMVTGDAHATEGVRMKAIEFLFDAVTMERHPNPALLLTHLSREDAMEAVKILRVNNLLK